MILNKTMHDFVDLHELLQGFFLPIYLPFSGTMFCPGLFNLVGGLLSWVIRGSFSLIIKWLFDVTYKLVRFAPLGFTCSRSESILRWKES